MDQLASEEDTDHDLEDETDVSTSNIRPSVLSAETSRTALILPTFTDNGEAPHPSLHSQYNDARKLGNISVAADSPLISSTNNPPSPEPVLPQPSRPRARAWSIWSKFSSAKLCRSLQTYRYFVEISIFLLIWFSMTLVSKFLTWSISYLHCATPLDVGVCFRLAY